MAALARKGAACLGLTRVTRAAAMMDTLGHPVRDGVLLPGRERAFKSGFFDFYRLAAPLSAPAGCRATPCSLVFFYVSFAD